MLNTDLGWKVNEEGRIQYNALLPLNFQPLSGARGRQGGSTCLGVRAGVKKSEAAGRPREEVHCWTATPADRRAALGPKITCGLTA